MAQLALVGAYEEFMITAQSYVHLRDEKDYDAALEALDEILMRAEDTEGDPMNPLIDMISHGVEQFEAQDEELMDFLTEADSMPADIALLRTLMQQHQITGSDLPEIGDKTMVSKVLSGKRVLSRQSIERLSDRFGIRPALFFGG